MTALAPAHDIDHFILRPLGASDGSAFRAVRLEALTLEPSVFAASREKEESLSPAQWAQRAIETPDGCWIGVFAGPTHELVGITQALTWERDPTGASVLFRSSYLRAEHRGEGVAGMFNKARQEWAGRNPAYKTAMLFHRKGHWIEKPVRAFGGVYSHTEPMRFADGAVADAIWYRKTLSPAI